MSRFLLALFSIVILASCSASHFYDKEEAIKFAKKRDLNKDGSIIIQEDKNILKVLTRDGNYQNVDEIYQFDEDGKQLRYSLIASCDSCYQKYFSKTFNNSAYQWRKINDSTYISKYKIKRVLNVHKSTFSYDIVLHYLSKEEHENLVQVNAK